MANGSWIFLNITPAYGHLVTLCQTAKSWVSLTVIRNGSDSKIYRLTYVQQKLS